MTEIGTESRTNKHPCDESLAYAPDPMAGPGAADTLRAPAFSGQFQAEDPNGQHALSTFFAGSIGAGSLITGAALLFPRGKALMPLIAIPVSYAPAVAAIAVVGATGNSAARAAVVRRMSAFRVDPRWYAAATIALPLVHVAGVRLAVRPGTPLPVHARALALLRL